MRQEELIQPSFIRTVRELLREGQRVRRRLPRWGRLYLDRRLPFLCIYRRPPTQRDRGTARLVTSQPAYLLAPGDADVQEDLRTLFEALAAELADTFDHFLLLEIWSSRQKGKGEESHPWTLRPAFHIAAPDDKATAPTVEAMAKALKQVTLHKQPAEISFSCPEAPAPPDLPPLLPSEAVAETNSFLIGLEVHPFFREARSGAIFPFLFDTLRNQLDVALRQTFFAFTCTRPPHHPPHYLALGRSRLEKTALEIDHKLANMDASFDFLLQTTPVNSRQL